MPKGRRFPQTREYVALNLKYARAMLGLTQEELAELADLDRTQVGAIERLVSGASVDSLGMLAKAVGVPAHVLLMPPGEAQPLILSVTEERRQAKAEAEAEKLRAGLKSNKTAGSPRAAMRTKE